jgi:hypothetical protein
MDPVIGLSLGRIVVGVLSFAQPGLATKMFGLDIENNPQGPYLARLFGSREIAIGTATVWLAEQSAQDARSVVHTINVQEKLSNLLLNVRRAESGQRGGAGVQNPINTQAGEWSYSADHVPHAFNFSGTYQLPFGKGSSGGMAKLLQGWMVNGILRHDSGRPLAISMNNDLGGLLFNTTKRPNVVSGQNAITDISGRHFDPNADRYFNRNAWVDPGPLQFGNAPSRDVNARGFKNITEDVSISKMTKFTERVTLRFEASAGNVTNRVVFCDPATNWSATANFGQVSLQCNQPRSVNLGLKFIY